jgi:hypothetical protein
VNPAKLRELRALMAAADKFESVKNAKTRVLAFLRLEHTKEEVEDFKEIDPPPSFGGVTQTGAIEWRESLLAYLDGLLDAG